MWMAPGHVTRLEFGGLPDIDDERRHVTAGRELARELVDVVADGRPRPAGRIGATPPSRRRCSRPSPRSRSGSPGVTGRRGRRGARRAGRPADRRRPASRATSRTTTRRGSTATPGSAPSHARRSSARRRRPRRDRVPLELVARQRFDGRHDPAEQPRTRLVDRPHPGEVARDAGWPASRARAKASTSIGARSGSWRRSKPIVDHDVDEIPVEHSDPAPWVG